MTDRETPEPASDIPAPVPIDSITTTPYEPTPVGTSSKARAEKDALDHERAQFRNELGLLGIPFGGRREKPGNISALVIVLCFLTLIGAFGVETWVTIAQHGKGIEPIMSFDRLFGGITSVITLVLGYLFGSNEKSDGS